MAGQLELQIKSAESEEEDEKDKSEETNSSLNNENVDKKALWKILKETQCPLMPHKYDANGKISAAYYFNNEFWCKDDDIDNDDDVELCRMIQFKDYDQSTLKEKAKDDAELIFAVDKYISFVHINKSYEIFSKLQTALDEANGNDDGDSSNDAYKKLIPTMTARIMFLSVFITTLLNGYFMVISFNAARHGKYNTHFMNIAALVMAICEVILYANILLGSILVFGISLIHALCTHNPTYVQSKVIAEQLRNLSTLSILRYMPSIEIVSSAIVHWRESIAKIWANFIILFSTKNLTLSKRKNICDVIFAIPIYLIELFAPILAVYAILVKIKQLGFAINGEPFVDWNFNEYITFVAFLNQVAGLRVLRNIETASIQHFVFSGSDASLDTDELLLLDDWWNTTVLSAVSNLHLGWYDNMVFWYSLDPQKIQLLLKNHIVDGNHGDGDSLLQTVKDNDVILENYDKNVKKQLMQITKQHF